MNRIIEITISPTGEAVMHTKGFAGSSCRDASKAMERALGIEQSDKPTAELYQIQTADQPLRQGNG